MVEFITLAVDTSTRAGQIALLHDRNPASVLSLEEGSAHGRELAPAIAALLAGDKVRPGDVSLVAVGLGPGSYTGLRVGAATALGFALGTGCPLSGVSSLAARALCVGSAGEVIFVVADAGNKDCYSAAFRIDGEGDLTEEAVHMAGSWEDAAARIGEGWIVTGDGAERLSRIADRSFESRLQTTSSAVGVGRLGLRSFRNTGPTPIDAFKPLYLRKSSAEINWELQQPKRNRGQEN